MVKDKRSKTVKILIEGNHIADFKAIFDHIPKTKVSEDLGINFQRIDKMISSVRYIKVGDIFLMSEYFEIDARVLFELIYNQRKSQNTKGSRTKK